MKVAFFMNSPGATRNFESLIERLLERGHRVELTFDSPGEPASLRIVERLRSENEGFSAGPAPGEGADPWSALRRALRLGLDYLRYMDPIYREADLFRARAERAAPAPIRRLAALPGLRGRRGRALLRRALAAAEGAVPRSTPIADFLRESAPDLVMVTPLVSFGSRQADYLNAARACGIPTCFCPHSWDNLTNKGLIRGAPDLVVVWNEAQRREAIELHGVPAERVEISGAHSYDHWFSWDGARERDAFCREIGLPGERPLLLFVCSSPFIAPDEVGFVRRWLEALRGSGPPLEGAGVLIRPHPQNAAQWRDVRLDDELAVIWPVHGANPMDDGDRADYFGSIHQAAAVIGINTSALIEAAILGKPVLSVLDCEFRDRQTGTLHFHYLLPEDGGFLRVAQSLSEHAAQLRDEVGDAGRSKQRAKAFVDEFIRPRGIELNAAPLLADALEAAAAQPAGEPAPPRRPTSFLWRLFLWPLARYAAAKQGSRRPAD